MSSKRISVGILITPSDADIAAYLNSLRDAGEKPAKWLSGMLIANEIGNDFPIPDFRNQTFKPKIIHSSPQNTGLLFGSGSTVQTSSSPEHWDYGWQVRGPHGEIIEGTVVSVSFCRPEVVAILRKMRENNLKISTYLKALMRHNMALDGPLVSADGLDQIIREYYLKLGKNSQQNNQIIIDKASEPSPVPKINSHTAFDETSEKNPLLDYIS